MITFFMKPSVREYWNGYHTVQEIRGYKLYEWQRSLLNYFGGNFPEHKVYCRS
jgi:hypothetical protein